MKITLQSILVVVSCMCARGDDFTSFIEPFHSDGVALCCCDSAGRFEFFSERTDECSVFFGESCGSFTQGNLMVALSRPAVGTRALRQYTGSPTRTCIVDDSHVHEMAVLVLQRAGQSPDPSSPGKQYCRPHTEEGFNLPGSALGDDVQVQCEIGYAASRDSSSCVYVSLDAGTLYPVPHCHRITDFCQDVPAHSSEGLHLVRATAYGLERAVSCDFAMVPVAAHVRCMADGLFGPRRPACVPDPAFCAALEDDGVSVGQAPWGGASTVSCPLGQVPEMAQVQCERDRTFSPTPKCTSIPDFCQAVPANAEGMSISEAALGEEGIVTCPAGSRLENPDGVICGEDGAFSFAEAPTCERVWNWCGRISDFIQRVDGVPEAAFGDRSDVACVAGSEAEEAQVLCGEDGFFHPEPRCVELAEVDSDELAEVDSDEPSRSVEIAEM